jgi:BASS family bile acid:Na+ symporter
MEALLNDIARWFTTIFAITTMLSMGLSLSHSQLLRPLKEIELVGAALIGSFVVVPAAAIGLAELLSLDADVRIGLVLAATAAGAPLAAKLAGIANASVPVAVSLVALLVVATIIYMPIALPLMLGDVEVDAFGMAWSLTWQMLLPLAIGLVMYAGWNAAADWAQPKVALLANISLVIMLVLVLGLNLPDVVGLFGSGAILALIAMYATALGSGYVLGSVAGARRLTSLATGQRNLAAAFVIAQSAYGDRPDVLAMLGAAGLIGFIIIIPTAIAFGRVQAQERTPARDVRPHPHAA